MALKQDYEHVWDGYAKTYTARTSQPLGDEWGTPERAAAIFQKYIEPNIGPHSVAAELGLGGGKYSIMVGHRVKSLHGIDISSEMLNLTADRLKGCNFIPVKTNGKHVAIESATVDFFYSFDSMVHIFPNDLFTYLEEIHRFLKPDGKAVFEFADWDSKDLMQKFMLDQTFYAKQGSLSPGAFGFISRAAIVKMAEHVGFRAVVEPLTSKTAVLTLTTGASG